MALPVSSIVFLKGFWRHRADATGSNGPGITERTYRSSPAYSRVQSKSRGLKKRCSVGQVDSSKCNMGMKSPNFRVEFHWHIPQAHTVLPYALMEPDPGLLFLKSSPLSMLAAVAYRRHGASILSLFSCRSITITLLFANPRSTLWKRMKGRGERATDGRKRDKTFKPTSEG